MDLAKDLLRLVEHVAQVPGLSTAFRLAIEIMKTVQVEHVSESPLDKGLTVNGADFQE